MCTPTPRLWCGGRTYSLVGAWDGGGGVNILEDAGHSSVLYICKYFVVMQSKASALSTDAILWETVQQRRLTRRSRMPAPQVTEQGPQGWATHSVLPAAPCSAAATAAPRRPLMPAGT
jgi:hypothetical protein